MIYHQDQTRFNDQVVWQFFFAWRAQITTHQCGYKLFDFIEAPLDETDELLVQQDHLLL